MGLRVLKVLGDFTGVPWRVPTFLLEADTDLSMKNRPWGREVRGDGSREKIQEATAKVPVRNVNGRLGW